MKTITIENIELKVKREKIYCNSWDHMSGSRYGCWKYGWELYLNDVWFDGGKSEINCFGTEIPKFRTFKDVIDEYDTTKWDASDLRCFNWNVQKKTKNLI